MVTLCWSKFKKYVQENLTGSEQDTAQKLIKYIYTHDVDSDIETSIGSFSEKSTNFKIR